MNYLEDLMGKVKEEISYDSCLEEACRYVFLKYHPNPSQCFTNYYRNSYGGIDKIEVMIGNKVYAEVICGKIDQEDASSIKLTNSYWRVV